MPDTTRRKSGVSGGKKNPPADEATAGPMTPLPPSVQVPPPPSSLAVNSKATTWRKGRKIHRVHHARFAANQFNPGIGNARFSPVNDASGKPIPTLYGGGDFTCAVMESVFHDLPRGAGMKTFDRTRLDNQVHSVVMPLRDLKLADLGTMPLKKLGVERRQLIDTDKDVYAATRQWAAAFHAQRSDIDGLLWPSRQSDRPALVLFGDRVAVSDLDPVGSSRSVGSDPEAMLELVLVAEEVGVEIL
ncbi:RES family NAD+ phosphorylase [Bacillus sp. NP157]|nr:RES family NAD+ phosphorylase [Bacillus sp. NP157]